MDCSERGLQVAESKMLREPVTTVILLADVLFHVHVFNVFMGGKVSLSVVGLFSNCLGKAAVHKLSNFVFRFYA